MTNPAMPGVCKIGRTCGDPDARARQLDNTSAPMPFEVWDSFLSPDCVELESLVHEDLSDRRVRGGREFFRVDAKDAALAIHDLLKEQVFDFVSEYLPDWAVISGDELAELTQMAAESYWRNNG
jgi:hypothetical protein